MSISEGFTDYMLRDGLGRTAAKLTNGEALTVAFIGGSVTAGAGASDQESTSYRALIGKYLMETYPQASFRFQCGHRRNRFYLRFLSVEGASLDCGIPDLLFVEFAVNDAGNNEKSIRAMEGIVSQARRMNPLIEICFLYVAIQKGAEMYAVDESLPANIGNHEKIAVYYRLSSVFIAREIYRRINSGLFHLQDISGDNVHPNDFGFSLYASFLQDFLKHALAEGGGRQQSMVLPEPMDVFCYEKAMLVNPSNIQATEI